MYVFIILKNQLLLLCLICHEIIIVIKKLTIYDVIYSSQ